MSTSGMIRGLQMKTAGTSSHPADRQTSKGLLIPSVPKDLGKQQFTFIGGKQLLYHHFVEQVSVNLEMYLFYDVVILLLTFTLRLSIRCSRSAACNCKKQTHYRSGEGLDQLQPQVKSSSLSVSEQLVNSCYFFKCLKIIKTMFISCKNYMEFKC